MGEAGDLEGEGQVAAHMLTQVFAVQPDPGVIDRRAEAQVDAAAGPARIELEFGLVPGRAEVVAGVVEQVIPAAGHRDRAGARRQAGFEPAGGLALVIGIQVEAPEAREVPGRAGGALVWIEQGGGSGQGRGAGGGGGRGGRGGRRDGAHQAQSAHGLAPRHRGLGGLVRHLVLPASGAGLRAT